MPVEYSLSLYSGVGRKIGNVDEFIALDAVGRVNGIGEMAVVLAAENLRKAVENDAAAVHQHLPDGLVDTWAVIERRYGGWREVLFDTAWQIKDIVKELAEGGGSVYTLTGPSADVLLESRSVLYYASGPNTHKGDYADDMMKDVVRENLVTATDADRNLSSEFFQVQADMSQGPQVTLSFAWQKLPDVLRKIAKASFDHVTTPKRLYYGLVVLSLSPNLKFEFRTWVNQRGRDRSKAEPLVFSPDTGSLIGPKVTYRYREEVNAVLVAGSGEGSERKTVTRQDAARSKRTPFSRRERFVDARSASDDELDSIAAQALARGRPTKLFEGTALDVPGYRYGPDWRLGDMVVAEFDGDAFDCRIMTVRISLRGKAEAIEARLTNGE